MDSENDMSEEADATTSAISMPVAQDTTGQVTSTEDARMQYPVQIQDGSTRELVEAFIIEGVTEEEATDVDQSWFPSLITLLYNLQEKYPAEIHKPDHWHWKWGDKIAHATCAEDIHLFFALKCQNEVQGMVGVIIGRPCRLAEHKDQKLVYVDYVSTAPWNLADLLGRLEQMPRYRAIGPALLVALTRYSIAQGFGGRIGLHSLQQAEDFYRDTCKMTDLGKDSSYDDLRYFEFSEEQASSFLEEE